MKQAMTLEAKSITWRDLFGNKYSKALHPAMLTEEGYTKIQRIKRVGDIVPSLFNVTYDREYAIEFISRKFCRSLSGLDKEELLQLVAESWDLYAKECLNPHFINRPID